LELLKADCPYAFFLESEPFPIRYPKKGKNFPWKMASQLPVLLSATWQEHNWLGEQAAKYNWQGIVSDNRYGMFHPTIPSVILAHQLAIRSGTGKFADRILQRVQYRFLDRFSQCWIPDASGPENLGGALSHPAVLPANANYIGPLSRFTPVEMGISHDLLVLLSGPEPQRTMLEDKLTAEMAAFKGKILFIRGLPGPKVEIRENGPVTFVNHLPTAELQKAISGTGLVIARSGYSTVMDLVCLRKKAILIPTTGQTEQEYLASYLRAREIFPTYAQDSFLLAPALDEAAGYPYRFPDLSFDAYRNPVDEWLEQLRVSSAHKPLKPRI
jgi:hypothetical protein